ncbi:MAG: tripartite tricarboxylate transporter substrate binding protein [Burkholderiales bacterium]|nr:tripartite tricarboxylate transporter substrate binding protein [Burkholderiales bacterium]
MNNRTKGSVLLAAASMALAGATAAQDYPNRAVRVIDPFSPGGATDVLARIVSQKLTANLGQPFVVENRAGGGGHIGADIVAKSPPNGYTLLVAGVPHAIGMTLYQKLPYDLARDLAPITQLATFPSMIVANPALPVKSMKDLLALARARPGEINFGANPGSPNHLAMELINTMAQVKMVHIGYKGAGPVVNDLLAGQLQVASVGIPTGLAQVQAGRLRAIAVTGPKRSALLPAVPTVMESGLPGYDVQSWYGMFCAPGTPGEIVAKLNSEIAAVLRAPDVVERLAKLGAEPAPTTPEQLGRITREEIKRWAKVVVESGAKVD